MSKALYEALLMCLETIAGCTNCDGCKKLAEAGIETLKQIK